jgi:hypothetical protein
MITYFIHTLYSLHDFVSLIRVVFVQSPLQAVRFSVVTHGFPANAHANKSINNYNINRVFCFTCFRYSISSSRLFVSSPLSWEIKMIES